MSYDPIRLEIFKHLFASIADEMGVVLRKSSHSPNIKERRDYSCAIFDAEGNMISQAAHIPVHLGSMPLSVLVAIEQFKSPPSKVIPSAEQGLHPGDVIILNDPYRGGTHLPDITLVSPVYELNKPSPALIGFVASRAHHADVGGIAPGSMPIAREIFQEGLIIPPAKLIAGGVVNQGIWDLILANVRTPQERDGDLKAQVAANRKGVERLAEMVDHYGFQETTRQMEELLAYTERITRRFLEMLPAGEYSFTDFLDDDGVDAGPIPISVKLTFDRDHAIVDFTGSAPQCRGSVNAVYAITVSAVFYVFRCLLDADVPNNSGSLKPIKIIAPTGSVVNALPPAPVSGGNVETSQRIVDVLLGALAKALPDRIPAASQGSMNNLIIGGWDLRRDTPFTYYETIGGGMGARPWGDGPSAIHSHMTNTLNTPIEALEYAYPLRVLRYEIRRGSAGSGRFIGGHGIRRDIQVLVDAQATLMTERRKIGPYGLSGGNSASPGVNLLVRNGDEQVLPGKGTFDLLPGDILSIQTPGGGGFGSEV